MSLGATFCLKKRIRLQAVDSLIRNVVYLVVILRTMNVLEEQASYWVANTFIWNWLLLPALPLAELLKQVRKVLKPDGFQVILMNSFQDVASSTNNRMLHWYKTSAYFALAFILFAIWAVSYPGWDFFVRQILNAEDPVLVKGLISRYV